MRGEYRGVQCLIKDVSAKSVFMWCYSHVLNLCATDIVKNILAVKNLISLLQSTATYISDSCEWLFGQRFTRTRVPDLQSWWISTKLWILDDGQNKQRLSVYSAHMIILRQNISVCCSRFWASSNRCHYSSPKQHLKPASCCINGPDSIHLSQISWCFGYTAYCISHPSICRQRGWTIYK